MKKKLIKCHNRGQSLMEYIMIASIVGTAMIVMTTYVFRSVQATQQTIQEEFEQNQ